MSSSAGKTPVLTTDQALRQTFTGPSLNKQQDGVIRMGEKSAIQRIKELDDERAKIFDQAKEEALQKATQAVADLNALGLKYQLVLAEGKGDEKQLKKGPAKPK